MSHLTDYIARLPRRQQVLRRRDLRRVSPRLNRDSESVRLLQAEKFAARELLSVTKGTVARRRICLVIAAYNEALVIEHTIRSAIRAGMSPQDIYVVNDASSDSTAMIARRLVGRHNVITVSRLGKGRALHAITSRLLLTKRYQWIHIADADGEFDPSYFKELHRHLDDSYAAATGYVASLPGGYISNYRGFEYGVGMDITRRFQAVNGVISIIPGPTSMFRADVFEQLNFAGDALCEDFDVTLQIHRQHLGQIQFIPSAIARTQDPGTFRDFLRQITRWNRGVMQLFFKHHIARHATKIDAYLTYQLLQNLLFAATFFVAIPALTIISGSFIYLATAFLSDVFAVALFTLFASTRTKRSELFHSFPLTYALRWVQLLVFLRAFTEVFLLRKYRITGGVWETVARRAQTTA